MYNSILTYLFAHPIALIAVIVAGLALLAAWFAAPVTWRDGEGRINPDDDDGSWWPRRLFRFFGW